MKNKILPLSLVTLVVCLGAFLISATVSFPDSYNPYSGDDQGIKVAKASEQYLTKLRNNQVTGLLNPADLINAREQADKIAAQKGSLEDLEWSFIGPDNVGGFTNAIMYDSRDATYSTIIAGAYTGGLYKSVNNGLTWNKINGIENNLPVSCIAQAPDEAIYVGTGGFQMGSGIYKSTDGENFTLLPSTDPNTGNLAFVLVNEIEINQNSGDIYAATAQGVYYSADQGATWDVARAGDTTILSGYSSDISIGSDNIVAASMDGLCYISDDGNPNTFVLHSSDTFNLPYEDVGYLELAIAPSNPDILYATVLDANNSELINIYKSDDRGVHWRIIAPGGSSILDLLFTPEHNVLAVFPNNPNKILVGGFDMWEGKQVNETGYYQWNLKSNGFLPPEVIPSYVHTYHFKYVFRPNTPNEILVGHNGGISRGLVSTDIIEFYEINKTYTTAQAGFIGFGGYDKTVIGGFDQNGVQVINGHGNPATAKNGKQVWSQVPPWGNNGGECFLSSIDHSVAIYSNQGGDFVRSEDMGENTSTTFFPTSISFPDDYLAPALYWENFENEFSRDSTIFVARTELPSGAEVMVHSNNRDFPFPYTLPVLMNPGDTLKVKDIVSSKFFVGTTNAVYMTLKMLDFGAEPEWFKIGGLVDGVGFLGLPSCMGMSDDANYLYVGTEEGELYRFANIKYAYDYDRADISSPYCVISNTLMDLPNIDGQIVTSVSVDPQNSSNVIVTLGNYGNDNYVFRSTNALDESPTFVQIQGNLPKMPVYSSIIEMNNSNTAIIGTDMGIYISYNINDASPTWESANSEIGKVSVLQLKQQLVAQNPVQVKIWNGVDTIVETYPGTENFGVIYAATYGRGLHISKKFEKPVGIFTPEVVTQLASIKVFPNPVSTQATFEYSLDEKAEVMIAVFDINGKMMISEYTSQAAGTHQYKLDCSSLPTGTYITSVHTGQAIKTGKFIVIH